MTTRKRPTLGSLFSGYGGLDEAVIDVFDAELRFVADIEPGPRAILARRHPDVPNLGDVTCIDWGKVEKVDILAGGSPCQSVSVAGARAGLVEGATSNLWAAMREAIAVLQPKHVIWENVDGAFSARAASAMESEPRCVGDLPADVVLRAVGRVCGDLASLGYDARWTTLLASDIGAPHARKRVFLLGIRRD